MGHAQIECGSSIAPFSKKELQNQILSGAIVKAVKKLTHKIVASVPT